MSWAEHRDAIYERLNKENFAVVNKYPKRFTKRIGGMITGVDLETEEVFFLVDSDRVLEDDGDTLETIRTWIAEVVDDPENVPEKPKPADKTPEPAAEIPKKEQVPSADPQTNILALINHYVGNDVLQIFGDTGAGKSQFCLAAARQAIGDGKTVYYLDTERNLTDHDITSLKGCTYHYTPVLNEIDEIVQNLPAVDMVILDSIGFPVLTTYARLSLKQKGDALLKLIAIFGDLKTWAYKNNGVAIVTNQPESEFNKEKGHVFRPFGDKSQFAAKEIWRTKISIRGEKQTQILISAFRSRSVGFGTKIGSMVITDKGIEVQS